MQCLKIGQVKSNIETFNISVVQGSICGPILFLLYINDIPNVSSTFLTTLFADDTVIKYSNVNGNTLINNINLELCKVIEWLHCNKLSLNANKTSCMLFSNRSLDAIGEVKIDNSSIKIENTVKYLGVLLNENFSFNAHIEYISAKISKTIGVMFRIRQFVPDHILLKLYYSLIYPYLIYCNIVWGNTNATYLNKILLLQKKIVRLITNSSYLAHSDPLFYNCKILKISDLYTYLVSIEAFKLYSCNQIHPVHNHNTRNREIYVQPTFHRLTLTQRSLDYTMPSIWNNNVPNRIKQSSSLSSFKTEMKNYLLTFYNNNN